MVTALNHLAILSPSAANRQATFFFAGTPFHLFLSETQFPNNWLVRSSNLWGWALWAFSYIGLNLHTSKVEYLQCC